MMKKFDVLKQEKRMNFRNRPREGKRSGETAKWLEEEAEFKWLFLREEIKVSLGKMIIS